MTRFVLFLFLAWPAASPAFAETIRLRVVHTNDMHGWIMARPDKEDGGRMTGGAAALGAAVAREREKGNTLVLDAGDWFQGTPEGNLPRGAALAEIFNAVGYDAVVIGNHEFDFGEEALAALVANIRVPVLGANIKRAATGEIVDYARASILKTVGGVKVGIFGLVTSRVPKLAFPNSVTGLIFEDEIAAAKRSVAELKGQGAEIIIALTHVGQESPLRPPFTGDSAIAAAVPGIDLIVGGHTHDAIPSPRPEPGGTLIVNAGSYLKTVGIVTLDFDAQTRRLVGKSASVRRLRVEDVGSDEAVGRIVARYQREVGRELDVVIGRAETDLARDLQRLSPVGGWMTDCIRKWTKTDVVIQNGGGIRSGLARGPVRHRHLFEVMPFDNYLTTLYMTGSRLREVFEHGVSFAPHRVQFSGADLVLDAARPRGERVLEISVRGRPLSDADIYSVTAPDFIVEGGDGYAAFAEGSDAVTTRDLVRDVLSWCARRYSPIKMPDLSRVTRK